jgi:hypothetical protein
MAPGIDRTVLVADGRDGGTIWIAIELYYTR